LLIAYAALVLFVPPAPIASTTGGKLGDSIYEEYKPVSVAAVRDATTGKAVFRTYREKKARVIDELSNFILSGSSTRDGVMRAYVRDTKLNTVAIKKIGDTLGPYEVVDITNEGLTLRRGGETVFLPKG
jgi:hypothetical protein